MSLGYLPPPGYYVPRNVTTGLSGPMAEISGPLARVTEVPDGFPGTATIVESMKRMALDAYTDERINVLAREVTMGCPRHDNLCEAQAILRWFQENFRYTRLPYNPRGFQRLQTPSYTLFDSPVKTGECASLSTAMAAMLMSMGFEVQFETGGQNPLDPLDFEHVYVLINVDGRWLEADPSYEGPLGWKHPNARVTMAWPLG